MWVAPYGGEGLVTGHIDIPSGVQGFDLDTFDTFFRQGLSAQAGNKGVTSSPIEPISRSMLGEPKFLKTRLQRDRCLRYARRKRST